MSRKSWLFLVVLGLVFSNLVQAHWSTNRRFHRWYLAGNYGYYGGYGGYGGGTVAGNYLMGMGAYFDGLGRLRVNTAIAARHFQQAYRSYLENKKLYAETYYELKEIRKRYLEKKRLPSSPEDLARYAREAAGARLRADQWDAATAMLDWPALLQGDSFHESCATIETLFEQRDANPELAGLGSEIYYGVRKTTDAMLKKLKAMVREVSADDYVQARRFLQTLAYEARFEALQN